ncbi:MAG: tyrosine-type recombinase/integrase [Myxococcaceae bacterium]|nr:tyrosine-type recombinase/integrase [Myxococcaceae bacterium]
MKERWPGGYVHRQADGQPLFIIERRVRGHRFHVSTRCHSLRAAMKQLERFEANPHAYAPEGAPREQGLVLTAELLLEFHSWQLQKGNTRKHANEMGNRLADWIEDFGGKDLRQLSLREDVKPALERRPTSRAHRIIALKAFFAWLRKEKHLLRSAEDCTLDLPVPQARPEKHRRRKAVPFEAVQAAAGALAPAYRDMLVVLAGTGWHVTELERFVRRPESELVHARRGDTLAVLVTRHKGGELTRTPVSSPGVLAAAERLRERGELPRKANQALKAACRAAGVAEFTLGVMRHSVATWAVEGGAMPEQVAEFLGHKDARTTRRFYADVAVPTTAVLLPSLSGK